jgi:hypothetical protein
MTIDKSMNVLIVDDYKTMLRISSRGKSPGAQAGAERSLTRSGR